MATVGLEPPCAAYNKQYQMKILFLKNGFHLNGKKNPEKLERTALF